MGKVSWNDRVKNEEILRRIKEDLSRFYENLLLNHVIDGEVVRRRERRSKQPFVILSKLEIEEGKRRNIT